MKKRNLSVIGVCFLFIFLLLTSVANAEFMRVEGDPAGWGYGYGFGFGLGFGWEGGSMAGWRISEDTPPDEYHYGFGFGYLNEAALSYDPLGSGAIAIGAENISTLVVSGQMTATGFDPIEGSLTGIYFNSQTEIVIDDNLATTTIPSGATITSGDKWLVGDGDVITGSSTVTVRGLPSGYRAVTGGAIQFGSPYFGLSSDKDIVISINVGSSYNGQTLRVLHQTPGSSVWTLLTSCAVSGGLCTFTTRQLSSFATTVYTAPAVTASVTRSSGRAVGLIAPIANQTVSKVEANKVAVGGNCYRISANKIQLLAKSSCYSRIYDKKTKKYLTTLKSGIKEFSSLARIGKGSAIYLIDNKKKCQSLLNITNGRTLVVARRVASITTKKFASYQSCLVAR